MADLTPRSRFSVLSNASFLRYFVSRFLITFSQQIINVAVGWQAYEITGDPFVLGMIGLIQFMPGLFLFLVAGEAADRYNRRVITGFCSFVAMLCSLVFLVLALPGNFVLWAVYGVLLIFGIERAFLNPAIQSLAPNLVPQEDVGGAVAWTSSSTRVAQVVGPMAGGLLYAVGAPVPYLVSALFFLFGALLMFSIPKPAQKKIGTAPTWETVTAGFKYILTERVLLGAISLDLFAVLLGGAVALMPIFAKDVLDLGPWALGLLRSAPAIGAIATALVLAVYPIRTNAGRIMFFSVLLFGLTTMLFGLSTSPFLSIVLLIVMGAADMVSVYIRMTLIALWTPDDLRGRVSAVSNVFIGASNELGAFRAGTMAAAIGAIPTVVIGGAATIVVGLAWMGLFPRLRAIDTVETGRPSE